MTLTDERIAEIRAQFANAMEMIGNLCKRRDEAGSREWVMSIPARPDYDPDLVIAAALDAVPELLREIDRLRADRDRDTTLVACSKCSFGVRARNLVAGMCGDCAGKEIERLREWQREAADWFVDTGAKGPAVQRLLAEAESKP